MPPADSDLVYPPLPARILTTREIVATAVVCTALVGFAAHLEGVAAWVFCFAHAWGQSEVIYGVGRWTRRHVLPRWGWENGAPLPRAAVIGVGLLLALGVLQVLDRTVLGDWYVRQGWVPAAGLERFNDAVLLVRTCVTAATIGLVAAHLSHQRMVAMLRSEAESRGRLQEAEMRRHLAEAEAQTARQLATEAELTALKMQIDPHFLFNTLGSIAVLARMDGARAGAMADKLAEIFRYTLQASKRTGATLGEELEFVEAYLDIQRERFGSRLSLTSEVPGAVRSLAVPNLLLQPLVENAIQHAFKGMVAGWRIELRAVERGDAVELTVADNGAGFGGHDPYGCIGRGTGLQNIDARLQRFYGPEVRLQIEQRQPVGAIFRVVVPRRVAIRA